MLNLQEDYFIKIAPFGIFQIFFANFVMSDFLYDNNKFTNIFFGFENYQIITLTFNHKVCKRN
jgi:hypothetical protein